MMVGKLKTKQQKKSCYVVSFCHIRTESWNRNNISDKHRQTSAVQTAFIQRKKLRGNLWSPFSKTSSEQMRQTGKGDRCPQFCCVSYLGGFLLFFLRFSPSLLTDQAESSRLALLVVLVFKLAQPCSRQAGPLPLYSRYLECLSSNSR